MPDQPLPDFDVTRTFVEDLASGIRSEAGKVGGYGTASLTSSLFRQLRDGVEFGSLTPNLDLDNLKDRIAYSLATTRLIPFFVDMIDERFPEHIDELETLVRETLDAEP